MKQRGAKIVATLGPAAADSATIRAMVYAGLDVVRLNFSHGDHASLATLGSHACGRCRPRAARRWRFWATCRGRGCGWGRCRCRCRCRRGSRCGSVRSRGTRDRRRCRAAMRDWRAMCMPETAFFCVMARLNWRSRQHPRPWRKRACGWGGTLTSHAGMNVPSASLGMATLTAQDRMDIQFAVEQGMDYLALSFVRRGRDLEAVRDEVETADGEVGLIAKIENAESLSHLTGILEAAGGVMVARGDLGVEVGPENVPVWQRRIIAEAAEQLVPVIVATQMLESMVENPRPSRAEASDVANAVWDGTDAVMLSAETAVGAYPVEAVAMMARIVDRAEEAEEAESVRQTPAYASEW